MRGFSRNRTQAEEEESVFVTMTDMTISFLLIIMILLAFFATQLSTDDMVPRQQYERAVADLREAHTNIRRLELELEEVTAERDELREQLSRMQQINPLEAYVAQAIERRREILIQLRERLLIEFPDLQVVISPEQDALRFQGEGLFRSGSSNLEPRQRQIVETMGRLLDEILVCFTLGERAKRGGNCNSGNALIETVQIEGHTDSDGSDVNNLHLSTDRANTTFLVMLGDNQAILAHENVRGQPVMSVSGYGEMRPIVPNDTSEHKAVNRRIDLRIIMYAPSTAEEVEEIGRRLDELRTAGGTE